MPFSSLLERFYKDLFDNRVDYNFHKGSKWGEKKGVVAIQLDEYDHIFLYCLGKCTNIEHCIALTFTIKLNCAIILC